MGTCSSKNSDPAAAVTGTKRGENCECALSSRPQHSSDNESLTLPLKSEISDIATDITPHSSKTQSQDAGQKCGTITPPQNSAPNTPPLTPELSDVEATKTPKTKPSKDIPKSSMKRCSSRVFDEIDKSYHNVIVPMEMLGKPIEKVYRGVHDGKELGTGITGIVRKVTHRVTGHEFAVKRLDLGNIKTEQQLQQLREEIAIMCQLDHPNVVRLEEVYESPTAIYLVQELCTGGDLFDRLDAQDDVHYTEAGCARIMKQIVDAVRYIHDKGIIHRDLKLENFMFSNEGTDSELRMIDFGLSKHFKFGDVQDEAVGSAYTVAPEVIRGEYNEKADEWSIGVITYLLLSGETPFGGAGEDDISPMQTRAMILSANYEFEPEYIWENVSQQAIDFIKSLLVTDPSKRPSVKALQKSEWIQVWADAKRKDEGHEINPNVVQALVSFKEKDGMLKLLSEVLAFTLLPGQLEELRKQFELLDPEGRGEISLGAMKRALLNNAGAGALGSLTEREVEDIFEAMLVRKGDMRIHWHEFIAAALGQVEIDDRNLELAFQRLDTEHRGYLEVENIIELMGGYIDHDEDRIREMWQDVFQGRAMDECRRVSKKEFVLLMKGQRREKAPATPTEDGPLLLFDEEEEKPTPLVVNRMLYRAHRQTRLAVLEASRRFEEEQLKRLAKNLNEKLPSESDKSNRNLFQASLIMTHSENAKATSDSVRIMAQKAKDAMQQRINIATKKSGRCRTKSKSDMAEFLNALSDDLPDPTDPRKRYGSTRKKTFSDVQEDPNEGGYESQ